MSKNRVCVCVCVWETDRKREAHDGTLRIYWLYRSGVHRLELHCCLTAWKSRKALIGDPTVTFGVSGCLFLCVSPAMSWCWRIWTWLRALVASSLELEKPLGWELKHLRVYGEVPKICESGGEEPRVGPSSRPKAAGIGSAPCDPAGMDGLC